MASITTVRTAPGYVFFAAKTQSTVPTVARLYTDCRFIDEFHYLTLIRKTPQQRGFSMIGEVGAAAPDQRDTKPQTVRACRPSCSCLLSVYNAYKLSVLRTFLFKLHVPVFLGEQRVVATESNIGASMKTGAALAHNNVACHDFLTAIDFDA